MAKSKFDHDVFISTSSHDLTRISRELTQRLQQAGLGVVVSRDLEAGANSDETITLKIKRSRKVLLVISPSWLSNTWPGFEKILDQAGISDSGQTRIIPLVVETCELPPRLSALSPLDLADPVKGEVELARLVRVLASQTRIFISYQPSTLPDVRLAHWLAAKLEKDGHSVFYDDLGSIDQEWAKRIQDQIEASDFFVVFLSETSVRSEVLAREIECAHDSYRRKGMPRLLPVRVRYDEPWPTRLKLYLEQLETAQWLGRSGNIDAVRRRLIEFIGASLLRSTREFSAESDRSDSPVLSAPPPEPLAQPETAIGADGSLFTNVTAPEPAADPAKIVYQRPGGVVRIGSQIYVERSGDARLRDQLSDLYGTTTTIRASRQTGKSSLLLRGLDFARQQGKKIVFMDLQLTDQRNLGDSETFLRHISRTIIDELDLTSISLSHRWQEDLGPKENITDLMDEIFLPEIVQRGEKLVLAIDETDRVVGTPVRNDFFGMLRAWHNRRAFFPIWENLDIVMAISTEPNLLMKDQNQSPFNVGEIIKLEDFDINQIAQMNRNYNLPLGDEAIPELHQLLGGHPYLTSLALYTVSTKQMNWGELVGTAADDQHPFGDHLRRYLWMLRDQPKLRFALSQIILHHKCQDIDAFHQLSQVGLIKGQHHTDCVLRCDLYERYFWDKLE